ncbi:MAG: superoxide dismutase [Clostridiales bacterium]|nr:superoxide dismutase [Clostridiales bacterium]
MFNKIELKYDFKDLEPNIDEETMYTHYNKHYNTYTENLNNALEHLPEFKDMDIISILKNIKENNNYYMAIRNNGGGYLNHSMYFDMLTPKSTPLPNKLEENINENFTNFDNFKSEIISKGLSHFGSGWVWVILENDKLKIITTNNQDNPYMFGQTPIMGIDLWEHAYYLKYKNLRKDYLENIFNIIDWNIVENYYNNLK